ncbi:MAG: hypothetical protein RXO23_06200 [Vulcanisaeta sp.]
MRGGRVDLGYGEYDIGYAWRATAIRLKNTGYADPSSPFRAGL